jgi:hypothetical protein
MYCDLLAGVALGVRSLLIEEARVLVIGETEVVSLFSTRRWIDWRDTGRDLARVGLDRDDPTSGPNRQPHALRLEMTYDLYRLLLLLSYLILQPLWL